MPVKKESSKKSAVKKVAPAVKKATKPNLQDFLVEVQKKAYDLYQERMEAGISGDEMSDWFAAEKEIKVKYHL
jgi:hypothetical protein